MELTLKRLLEQAEFNQVRRGGYDRDEVNTLLDRAVAMATKVEAKLTETLEQARSASGPAPADIEAEIERRVAAEVAAEVAAQRPRSTGPSDEEQAEQVARALVIAQQSADAAVAEARRDAERIRAEAANQAEDDRRRAKERVRAEIDELEGIRESLRTDIGLLERHVEEQRSQLRSTMGELQRLLDDPKGFRLAPSPALSEVAIPEDDSDRRGDARSAAAEPASPEPEPASDRGPEPNEAEAAPVDDGALDFGEVDHAPPAIEPSGPTQPVPTVAADDDLFMAELRKAIEDEEPLGPRDSEPIEDDSDPFGPDRRGWRFGRR